MFVFFGGRWGVTLSVELIAGALAYDTGVPARLFSQEASADRMHTVLVRVVGVAAVTVVGNVSGCMRVSALQIIW